MFRWLNPEIALGFLVASVFWAAILGWQAAYAPNEIEKQQCYEAAQKTGHKTEECKTLWERTTSDPIALFTFVLAISTIGLWVATGLLYGAGKKQIALIAEQTALARDDFNATHRPWVPITKVDLNFGLRWAQGNVIVGLNVYCKNIGSSPARRVSLAVSIFPFLCDEDVRRELAKLQIHHATSGKRELIDHTLFPNEGDELRLSRALVINKADIEGLKDVRGNPASEMIPVIIGAVEYYFSFGERVPHYTPFVYHLWSTDTVGVANKAIQLNGPNLEPDQMMLVRHMNAGDPT